MAKMAVTSSRLALLGTLLFSAPGCTELFFNHPVQVTLNPIVAASPSPTPTPTPSPSPSPSASPTLTATSISISNGNNLSGVAGSILGTALVVQVLDQNANVMSGVTVDWAIAAGGGSVTAASSQTDGSGLASMTVTLGTVAGVNQVTATIHGTSTSVTFSETGIAGAASTIAVSSGNNQSELPAAPLTNPMVVIVRDINGNAVGAGVTVNWNRVNGLGTVTAASSTTDASGLASMTFTNPNVNNTAVIIASLPGVGAQVNFIEIATNCLGNNLLAFNMQAGTGANAGSPYYICTADQLNSIGTDPTLVTKYYVQGANIDLSTLGATPFNIIGASAVGAQFQGTYDGSGFLISGLNLTGTADYVGLFGYARNATITNVHLNNPTIGASGYDYVGTLVGYSTHAVVSNCSATGATITGRDYVGGLIGWTAVGTTVTDSNVTATTVNGRTYVGGFTGHVNGTTSQNFTSATVNGSGNYLGGFVGFVGGTIDQCYATGNVVGSQLDASPSTFVGGFFGGSNCGPISNSYSLGGVTGADIIGGFGGSASSWPTCDISNVYTLSPITSGTVGGTPASFVGGLIGSYTAGNGAVITEAYWSTDIFATSPQGTGQTTAWLNNGANFSWNNTIWGLANGFRPWLIMP